MTANVRGQPLTPLVLEINGDTLDCLTPQQSMIIFKIAAHRRSLAVRERLLLNEADSLRAASRAQDRAIDSLLAQFRTCMSITDNLGADLSIQKDIIGLNHDKISALRARVFWLATLSTALAAAAVYLAL